MPEIYAVNPLGTEKIGKLMLKYSIPSVVAIIINSIYNLVDQIFIGQGVGYLGNAATNVILPFVTFAMGVSMLIGDGASAYLALNLGRGRVDEASKAAGNAMTLAILSSITMSIICEIAIVPLCYLFGATESSLPYAIEYGRIIILGFPVAAIDCSFGGLIRADGRPKPIMTGLIIGCIANIILDPVFIFVFKMGVAGAGWATITGQALNAVYFIICVSHFRILKIEKRYFIPTVSIVTKIAIFGLASFITQFASVIVCTILNKSLVYYGALSPYGADIPLAALGITMKVSQLIMGFTLGIATGIQPILSYNYGSRQLDRLKKCLIYALVSTTVIMIFAFIIFQVFPDKIVLLFGTESEMYMDFSVKCFRIYLSACFCIGIGCVTSIFFQAICKPIQSTFLSLSRQIIIFIPAILILGAINGIDGLLLSGPIADGLSGIISLITLAVCWKGIFRR